MSRGAGLINDLRMECDGMNEGVVVFQFLCCEVDGTNNGHKITWFKSGEYVGVGPRGVVAVPDTSQ